MVTKSVTGAPLLQIRDINNGALGEVNITFSDGRKYNGMNVITIEANLSYDKKELGVLGTTHKGHKKLGTNGTGNITMYDTTSVLREFAQRYQDSAVDEYFNLQIVQLDPSSRTGRQAITYFDCNIDNIMLSHLDINASELTCEMAFTFEDYNIDESYTDLDGVWV